MEAALEAAPPCAASLASCLLELSRLVRATGFYDEGDPVRRELLDRAHAAWNAETVRTGAIELGLDEHGFVAAWLDERIEAPPLSELARAMGERGIEGLRFDRSFSRDALDGLARLLGDRTLAPGARAAHAAFGPWAGLGIELFLAPPDEGEPAFAATHPGLRHPFADPLASAGPAAAQVQAADSPADAGAAELHAAVDEAFVPDATSETATQPVDAPDASDEASEDTGVTAPLVDLPVDTAALDVAASEEASESAGRAPAFEDGALERDPIGTPGRSRGVPLRERLRALEACRALRAYEGHCDDVIACAEDLARAGAEAEAYRAALVLTRHASGAAGLDPPLRQHARTALQRLCHGALLDFAIERTSSTVPSVGVRAAQVLLQVGEPAVPAILARLRAERDAERSAQLAAVVIALGERSVEPLREEIERMRSVAVRTAVQLAGELQSPKLVPSLVRILHSEEPSLRKDAARALVMIGNAAHPAFVDALASPLGDLARSAAHCLGLLGHRRAVRPLLETLERALRDRDEPLAREVMRALAEIGDSRAVGPLAAVAGKRALIRRRSRFETRLAAIGALERIGDESAVKALHKLAASRDARIAERAANALAHCAPHDLAAQAAAEAAAV